MVFVTHSAATPNYFVFFVGPYWFLIPTDYQFSKAEAIFYTVSFSENAHAAV